MESCTMIKLQYSGDKGSKYPYYCPACQAKFEINIFYDNKSNELFCPVCEVKNKTPSIKIISS